MADWESAGQEGADQEGADEESSGPTHTTRPIGYVKARLAQCVREVEAGATMILTRHGRPVARLVPYRSDPHRREHPEGPTAVAREVRETGWSYGSEPAREFVSIRARREALRRLLEEEIWPLVPEEVRGKRISKREWEEILGYGTDGV